MPVAMVVQSVMENHCHLFSRGRAAFPPMRRVSQWRYVHHQTKQKKPKRAHREQPAEGTHHGRVEPGNKGDHLDGIVQAKQAHADEHDKGGPEHKRTQGVHTSRKAEEGIESTKPADKVLTLPQLPSKRPRSP